MLWIQTSLKTLQINPLKLVITSTAKTLLYFIYTSLSSTFLIYLTCWLFIQQKQVYYFGNLLSTTFFLLLGSFVTYTTEQSLLPSKLVVKPDGNPLILQRFCQSIGPGQYGSDTGHGSFWVDIVCGNVLKKVLHGILKGLSLGSA